MNNPFLIDNDIEREYTHFIMENPIGATHIMSTDIGRHH